MEDNKTHSHSTHDVHHMNVDEHHQPSNTKQIWKTFWILLGITVFEVGIAFTSLPKGLLKWTFIGLTIVKSYYIVGYFMHLKHEKPHFAWVILLPFVLIIYFIAMLICEGNYIGSLAGEMLK